MLSYVKVAFAQSVIPSDASFYHFLGILAIIAGVASACLIAFLTSPRNRLSRQLNSIRKDPFNDPLNQSWKASQESFFRRVMSSADGDAPTIVPPGGPERHVRSTTNVKVLQGTVFDEPQETCPDEADAVLAKIRESNEAFLKKWGIRQ